MKKKQCAMLMRVSIPCVVAFLVLSSSQLMAGPSVPEFGRSNSQAAAMQSKMLAAKVASQSASRSKGKVAVEHRTSSGFTFFTYGSTAADHQQYNTHLASTRRLESADDNAIVQTLNGKVWLYVLGHEKVYTDGLVCGKVCGAVGEQASAPGLTGAALQSEIPDFVTRNTVQ